MADLHVREFESSRFRKRYQINVCWIIFIDYVYQMFCLTQCRCFLSNSIFWILIQKFSLTVPPIQSVCPHFTCWSKSFTDTYEKEFTSYLVWEGSNYGEWISMPEFFKLSLFASKFWVIAWPWNLSWLVIVFIRILSRPLYNIKKWKYTSSFIPALLLIIIFVCWEACTNFPVVSENVLWSVKNTFDMKTNLMCQQQFKHFRYIIIIWKWMIVQCYATIEYVLYWIKTNRQIF